MLEYFETIWNSPGRYAVIMIGVILVLTIPYMVFMTKRNKKNIQRFLEEHPNAAKAIIKGAAKGSFMPLMVNGEKPVTGNVGARAAIYLAPGENVIDFQYTWTRPGVMYKTVTTTIGPSKITVQAEPYKSYYISFDKKEEACKFEEIE